MAVVGLVGHTDGEVGAGAGEGADVDAGVGVDVGQAACAAPRASSSLKGSGNERNRDAALWGIATVVTYESGILQH